MHSLTKYSERTGKRLIIMLFVVSIVAPSFFIAATPKQAHAQAVGAITCLSSALGLTSGVSLASGGVSAIGGAGSAIGATVPVTVAADPATAPILAGIQALDAQTADHTGSLLYKDCVLDPLVWAFKDVILQQITASIVDWINSGFEGAPTFIQDPSDFFLSIGDQIAGEFITAGGLEFLCSPFKIDIQIQLLIEYFSVGAARNANDRLACSLSGVISNVDQFLAGDFSQGGWPGWFALTLNPSNNPYGAFLQAEAQLGLRIRSETGEERLLLEFGDGFLSIRDEDGNVITPGQYISRELEDWTGAPLAELEVADEVDEIISALMQFLVREILTGAGGLLGVSQSSYNYDAYDRASYTNQIRSTLSTENASAKKTSTIERITAVIDSETAKGQLAYMARLNTLLADANAVDVTSTFANQALARIASNLATIENAIIARDSLIGGPVLSPPPPSSAPQGAIAAPPTSLPPTPSECFAASC